MSFSHTIPLDSNQEIAITANKYLPLGTRGVTEDGRVFRYAQAGATALKANVLVTAAAQGPGSTATDQVFYSAYAAGTTYVKMQLSTVTDLLAANYLEDGWLIVPSTDITHNQMVAIDSNEALVSATALNQQTGIWLKSPGLRKVVATSTSIAKVVANPYKKVIVAAQLTSLLPLGVTPVAVTANYYFWLQTWGPALLLFDTGGKSGADQAVLGKTVFIATGGTGAVCIPDTTTAYRPDTETGTILAGPIGNMITCPPADTFFGLVNLTLNA